MATWRVQKAVRLRKEISRAQRQGFSAQDLKGELTDVVMAMTEDEWGDWVDYCEQGGVGENHLGMGRSAR